MIAPLIQSLIVNVVLIVFLVRANTRARKAEGSLWVYKSALESLKRDAFPELAR